MGNLRARYLEGVEDPLVDQANVLAVIAGHQMENGQFNPDAFYDIFQEISTRKVSARIYKK